MSAAAGALAARWRQWRAMPATQEDRNIRLLYLDTATGGLVAGGVYTFLPVFLVRLGASSFLVSLVASLPAILTALLVMPAGLYVERQRDLVRFTTWGRVIHRLFFLLLPLAPFVAGEHLTAVMVVLWTLKAIPEAFVELSWTAVMAEVAPAHRLARVNGNRWAMVSVLSALSVAAFGYLLEGMAFPTNYQTVFFISFLSATTSIFVLRLVVLPPKGETPAQEGDGAAAQGPPSPRSVQANRLVQRLRETVGPFVETPAFVRYLATTLVLRFGMHLPEALYSIYWIRHLDASDAWIGWQATAAGLARIVGYYVWGRIATKKGHYAVLMICTIGVSAYPLLTGLNASSLLLPLVAVVNGFFFTGVRLSLFDTLLHVCPADKRPSFVAVSFLGTQAALFVAPMAGSLLADWLDIRAVFFVGCGIHLLAAVLFRTFRIAVDEEWE